MKWYLKAIKNYAGFTGRARRKEFWLFCLFSYMVLVIYGFFKAILHLPEYEIETFFRNGLFARQPCAGLGRHDPQIA